MAKAPKPDVLAEVDHLLAAGGTDVPPWRTSDVHKREYVPDYAMLRDLLAVPIEQGHARSQQSGRVAKSLDAYIAYELRRAGFDAASVFPRAKQPRVLAPELADVERAIARLIQLLDDYEALGNRLQPPDLRSHVNRVARAMPGISETKVLGRFYSKQVDAVVLSDWLRGPDVLVSGKTQFSSYLNNRNNRYEEAIGEAHNLRDRYPLTAMGFAFLVRSNVFDGGAYELLRDLLARLRRPDGPFDGTVMLVADWDEDNANPKLNRVDDPAPALTLPRFFEDLLDAAMSYTPVEIHERVRAQKQA